MKQLAFFIGSLLLATQVHARAIVQIYPMELTISPNKKTDALMVANKGEDPLDIQVSANSWDMDENGKFVEKEIGEFVFYPRMLHILPKEEKAIKIGYSGDFPALEKSYRLILAEIPPVKTVKEQEKSKKVGLGITWAMHLSVPLFVAPSTEIIDPNLKIDEVKKTKTGWSVAVRNLANAHVYVKKLGVDLTDASKKAFVSSDVKLGIMRILPQRRVFIDIPIDSKKCSGATGVSFNFGLEHQTENYLLSLPVQSGDCLPMTEQAK